MRLFVGLRPSDSFRAALHALQRRLMDAGVTGRFLDPGNLHMTLAFIGEWPEDITALLPEIKKPFELTLSGIGIFPGADVLWAGVEKSEALDNTAKLVRHILADGSIPFDRKAFRAHITLARKPSVPRGLPLTDIAVPRAVMTVREVCLYRSDRGKNGMNYTVIGSSAQE